MIGVVIIFITIVAGVSNLLWVAVWLSIRNRDLDIQAEAIEENRKLQAKMDEVQAKMDEVQNLTASEMVSDFIKNIVDGDD